MIQIYKAENTNYHMNGDTVIHPLKCEALFNLNSSWSLELENPIDNNYELLQIGNVLSVPTPYGKRQLYRIFQSEKTDTTVLVQAVPIFFDSRNDCFLWDVRPTNKNGQDALDYMLSQNTKYTASSNIKKVSSAYYIQKNLLEAINGNDENSFINRWGGEIAFNNYQIIINDRIGSDNGLRVEFGFNLTGIKESIDMTDVVTRIIPKAYNGYILPNNETVDSPLLHNYPIVYYRTIEYSEIKLREDAQSNDEENEAVICDTIDELYQALRTRAKKEYENGIDKPSIMYDVSMINLSRTNQYKDYDNLLSVNLGDTVHIKHRKLNIITSARVISMSYDCITEKVSSLTLGDYQPSYFDSSSSIIQSASKVIDGKTDTLMAHKIKGVIDLMNASLKAQKSISQKQDVRAILFEDTDINSPTFGAMCLGTQGIQISKKRNETDTGWLFGTSIDFEGIVANYIITGILSDRNGRFFLNLDTGESELKDGKFSGRITSESGEIGGFIISSEGLTKTVVQHLKKTYTSSDVTRVRNIINGSITPTSSDYTYYDVNGDGKITSADYVFINSIFVKAEGNVIYTDIIINANPYSTNDINASALRVRYRSAKGNTIYDTSISARLIKSPSIESDSIVFKSIEGGIGRFKTDNLIPALTVITNSDAVSGDIEEGIELSVIKGGTEYEGGKIFAGYYNNKPNLYVLCSSGYLTLGCNSERLYLDPQNGATYSAMFYSREAGKCTLGRVANRFYNVYLTMNPNVSSDRRLKTDFTNFDERYIKLYEMLEPTLYHLINQPEEKSKHGGFIAQQVENAMIKCGIDKREFGIVKYDEECDEYALIYDMFISLQVYYTQYTNKKNMSIISDIDKRLKRLEGK